MLSKIFLVTKREYITRVRKKSFIVMTIAAPSLLVLFYGVIIYFAVNRDIGATKKDIYVSDETGAYVGKLNNNDHISFTYGLVPRAEQEDFLNKGEYYGLLVIPAFLDSTKLITKDQAALSTVLYIEKQLEDEFKTGLMKSQGIDTKTLKDINSVNIRIKTIKATEKGLENGNVGASTVLGYGGAIIIYMFIFIYGVQIMRGVIEEKSNRIVEVIISSVKPFELMFGKIAGIALVGLTQFTIWVLLVTVLGGGISGVLMQQMGMGAGSQEMIAQGGQAAQQSDVGEIMGALSGFNFTYLLGMFLFYFLGGYLFYGALFAAIGSAVDNETDTQQFMLPVTMPLIFALVLAQSAIATDPNGTLAFWLSIIPLTSPVVMMVRLPFDVPLWQTLLSMASLVAGFIFTTWLAGRIYRVGILMYGKKPTYKLMAKWLFSKE